MSVGFIDGEPKFSQGSGGISVNASNNNLDQEKFEQVLGKDLANKFLQIMQEKAVGLKGEHPAKDEFRKLVQNPRAFQAKLDSFAKDENGQELRKNFVKSSLGYKEVSPELFTILARDKDNDVLISVAQHPNTPPEVLTALSGDKDERVRYFVAENPNTPPELLTALSKHEDEDVRLRVAQNPKTPRETLAALAGDKDEYVRAAVAENPNTPPEALTALAKDKDKDVRNAAVKTLKALKAKPLVEAIIMEKVWRKLLRVI